MKKILLSEDTITKEDLEKLSEWILTNPRLTIGDKTREFEEEFAKYIGTKYSVFVNSGSSALLLMLCSLVQQKKLSVGDSVAVSNLSWSTDVSSILHSKLNPVFIDCNMQDLSVDLWKLEQSFKKDNIRALLLVSVLGLVPEMNRIVDLCNEYNVILLEDVCESTGSEYDGNKLGSMGYASVFSTYFGHHISTIEGGLICTDDFDYYNILKSMRSHGWDRDLDEGTIKELRGRYGVNEFKSKFTFYYPSFNFRPTDLQAFIGLEQVKRLPSIIEVRENNFKKYVSCMSGIGNWIPISYGNVTSNFAYPIFVKNTMIASDILNANNIENRPLICGDMGLQPFVSDIFGVNYTYNASFIDSNGMYLPNHPNVTFEEIEIISNLIRGEMI